MLLMLSKSVQPSIKMCEMFSIQSLQALLVHSLSTQQFTEKDSTVKSIGVTSKMIIEAMIHGIFKYVKFTYVYATIM